MFEGLTVSVFEGLAEERLLVPAVARSPTRGIRDSRLMRSISSSGIVSGMLQHIHVTRPYLAQPPRRSSTASYWRPADPLLPYPGDGHREQSVEALNDQSEGRKADQQLVIYALTSQLITECRVHTFGDDLAVNMVQALKSFCAIPLVAIKRVVALSTASPFTELTSEAVPPGVLQQLTVEPGVDSMN